MTIKHENVKGNIHISHKAIAKIVSSSVQTIREVTALVDGRNKQTDQEMFYKAVGVRIEEAELFIDLHTVILLSTPLHLLSRILQTNVKEEVERMTGLVVAKVNIDIVEVIPVI
ncbi:Asp23/Gls24 family envelope stress response protein [Paenibacillus tritici]|uniref:Asp23/Gls24 family envelope stress response protein n=1 Tax=Paenibacillus tritici TaxID=1873425 RepID=UPI001BA4907D|nr:Asp23/Gls24 family envelope stress response protein [Paenibacillus tritici]QUL53435.1 Asp23/Gls24 family envelope stress response protein [Paenibacillus tritici]